MSSLKSSRGFHVIEVIIGVVVIAVIGFIVWRVWTAQQPVGNDVTSTQPNGNATTEVATWTFNETAWAPNTQPPACPNPLLLAPADLTKVTSLLHPGQVRGGDYKPHGGLRFDNSKNSDIVVKLAMDSTVVEGARYIESGEVQYMFDFVNSCGIRLRYDHLLTLSEPFQKLADTLPAAQPDDSRTTTLTGSFTAGDVIASAVGHTNPANVSFDFGVYDLRQINEAARSADYQTQHADEAGQAYYAICWFDKFSNKDNNILQALTAIGVEGVQSDYCK